MLDGHYPRGEISRGTKTKGGNLTSCFGIYDQPRARATTWPSNSTSVRDDQRDCTPFSPTTIAWFVGCHFCNLRPCRLARSRGIRRASTNARRHIACWRLRRLAGVQKRVVTRRISSTAALVSKLRKQHFLSCRSSVSDRGALEAHRRSTEVCSELRTNPINAHTAFVVLVKVLFPAEFSLGELSFNYVLLVFFLLSSVVFAVESTPSS